MFPSPLPFEAEYYSQRGSVSGTLLIAEATFITPQAGGYPNIPEIYSDAQIAAWKTVTDAVHANGSFIFLQLWALGRTAHPDFLNMESGTILKSASDLPMKDGAVPVPLTEEEIWKYVGYYKQAAKCDFGGFWRGSASWSEWISDWSINSGCNE